MPRIIPTERGVDLNIEKLSKPDSLDSVKPIVATYEAWIEEVAVHPVDKGLTGPHAAELIQREKDKLLKDIGSWKSELEAIRCGIAILEESRTHWGGPGVQKDARGFPFEAWVAMNQAIADAGNIDDSDHWRASTEFNGSPGTEGLAPINSVVINEVLTHTDLPQLDSIELFNPTGATIDLTGFYLSDDSGNYKKFRIPDGTILGAGEYLALCNQRPA